jgi:hypothetical protein
VHTKLHINIHQGVVDVEGDSDLVREVYSDFKGKLLSQVDSLPPPSNSDERANDTLSKAKPKRRSVPRKKATAEEGRRRGDG